MSAAKLLMIIGALVFFAGLAWYFLGDKLHWIGRLPGDIRIERENFKFYFPITTLVIFSILVSLIVQVVKRFL